MSENKASSAVRPSPRSASSGRMREMVGVGIPHSWRRPGAGCELAKVLGSGGLRLQGDGNAPAFLGKADHRSGPGRCPSVLRPHEPVEAMVAPDQPTVAAGLSGMRYAGQKRRKRAEMYA